MQADILCAAEIEKHLTKARKGNITVFDTVDSTNTVLKNLCAEGKARPGDCVTADCQTKGRGRRGRRFVMNRAVLMANVSAPVSLQAAAQRRVSAVVLLKRKQPVSVLRPT